MYLAWIHLSQDITIKNRSSGKLSNIPQRPQMLLLTLNFFAIASDNKYVVLAT
jgi:hypothetical protein